MFIRLLKNTLPTLLMLLSISSVAVANNTFEIRLEAMADHISTHTNTTSSVAVLDNDQGKNIRISASSSFSQEGGQVAFNLSKTKIHYTPARGFNGVDSFWYEITDQYQQKKTAVVNVLVTNNLLHSRGSLNFKLIPIHYQLLNGEPHTWQENRGLTPFNLAQNANRGDTTITLSGNSNLHESELVAYISTSGSYHVAQVASREGNLITFTQGLKANIAAGIHLWNFYQDSSHPNAAGYRALADFSISQLDARLLNNKSHAFIGDSWLDNDVFENRIRNTINVTQSINKAVGGARSIDTLNTFDDDFPANQTAPDFFWVALGTNDYWNHISSQDYIINMTKIIEKINALGATAIILNSSVGPDVYDPSLGGQSAFHKELSHRYADGLLALAENNQGTASEGSVSGGVPSQNGGGSILWLELLLLIGLYRRRKIK